MFKFFRPSRNAISQAVNALSTYQINETVKQRFATFLQYSKSWELYHANPRLIAERLELTEQETLRLLIIALKEGLVTLNWELKCSNCSALNVSPKKLMDLRTKHTCPCCHYVNTTNADHGVQVTFSIDQRLRKLKKEADNPTFRTQINTRYGVVSGHRLLTLQTFRDLFPRETIPPNESLVIQRVAILFTDLVGSTAIYSRQGDSQAYNLVRQHFERLFQVVDLHNGAVVKTIGDAIMAAFTVPTDALEAAIAMHQQLKFLNQQLNLPPQEALILKIGIDAGPCISVSLNDRLDYFGITVNTAARVQSTSKGNDVAITDSLFKDKTAKKLISNFCVAKSNLILKGLEGTTIVHHVQPEKMPINL